MSLEFECFITITTSSRHGRRWRAVTSAWFRQRLRRRCRCPFMRPACRSIRGWSSPSPPCALRTWVCYLGSRWDTWSAKRAKILIRDFRAACAYDCSRDRAYHARGLLRRWVWRRERPSFWRKICIYVQAKSYRICTTYTYR